MRTNDIMIQSNRLNGNSGNIQSLFSEDGSSAEEVEFATVTLVIGVGGTGAEEVRRLKAKNPRDGQRLWSVLVFDSDARTQEPVGDLPGFTSGEFCMLPSRVARDVVLRPDYHPAIVERLGLSEARTWQSIATIASRPKQGNGQVRPLGYVSLAANYEQMRTRIRQAADGLLHRWTTLAGRLNTKGSKRVKLQRGIEVRLLGSLYGGSGSSWFIDLAAAVRHELGDMDLSMDAILTLPDVHEDVLQGKVEEQVRIEANCVAAATELDYFQTGKAASDGFRIGDPETKAPVRLFDHVYLVGRHDSDGRSIGKMEDVFDIVSLHLAGDLGTTIGGKFKTVEANGLVIGGLSKCPITGRRRDYSTLSATALVIPAQRLTKHLACRSVAEFLEENAIGEAPNADEICLQVIEWTKAAQLDEGSDSGAGCISARLQAAATPSLNTVTAGLYEDADGGRPRYFTNKLFVPAILKAEQAWKDSGLPEITQRLSEQTATLVSSFCDALNAKANEMADAKGLRAAASFLAAVNSHLELAVGQVTDDAKRQAIQAADASVGVGQAIGTLNGFWKGMGKNAGAQEEAVRLFRARASCDLNSAAKSRASVILSSVKEECQRLSAKFISAIEHLQTKAARLRSETVEFRQHVERTATTYNVASGGEIDVVSPEFLDAFYTQKKLSSADHLIGAGVAMTGSVSLLDGEFASHTCAQLVSFSMQHFSRQLDELTISDVLKYQLEQNGEVARLTLARFEEAFQACRPMWQAEIGVTGQSFSDSLIVGIPEGFSDLVAGSLSEVTRDIQANLNQDSRYQARIDFVQISDPHRIYILRRSHGGLPVYLSAWKKYRQSYDSWTRSGTHPIHIFSASVVDAMTPLMLQDADSEGEKEFALASAYGAVARRGSWYYLNLMKSDQAEVFELPVPSCWDCIPFQSGALRADLGSLQHLVTDGKLVIGDSKQPDRAMKLSEQSGRAAALKAFLRSQKSVRLTRELHDALCTASGNVSVARDLERYVAEILKATKPSDELYTQMRRELTLIRREIEKLRSNR